MRAIRNSFNYDNQEGDGLQTGISTFADELWQAADARPSDIDVASIYDDYPAMVLAQLNDLGMIPDNDLAAFARRDIGEKREADQHLGRHDVGGPAGGRPADLTAYPKPCCNCSIAPASGRCRARRAVTTGYGMTLYRYSGTAAAAILERMEWRGIGIWRCRACGAAYFPERLLCSRCHGHEFILDHVTEGVVEEITVIRHVLGQTDWQPHRLANVRTGNGPRMTVGLRDESGPAPLLRCSKRARRRSAPPNRVSYSAACAAFGFALRVTPPARNRAIVSAG